MDERTAALLIQAGFCGTTLLLLWYMVKMNIRMADRIDHLEDKMLEVIAANTTAINNITNILNQRSCLIPKIIELHNSGRLDEHSDPHKRV